MSPSPREGGTASRTISAGRDLPSARIPALFRESHAITRSNASELAISERRRRGVGGLLRLSCNVPCDEIDRGGEPDERCRSGRRFLSRCEDDDHVDVDVDGATSIRGETETRTRSVNDVADLTLRGAREAAVPRRKGGTGEIAAAAAVRDVSTMCLLSIHNHDPPVISE